MGRTSVILLSSLSALLVLISVQAANIGYGSKRCPPGKEYTNCGSRCRESCGNVGKDMACAAMCESGCFCPKDTLNDGSGKCVKMQECCKGNTTYSEAGNDCGRVCPRPFRIGMICPPERRPGCFCKPGYKLLGNRCILEKDCPKITFHP